MRKKKSKTPKRTKTKALKIAATDIGEDKSTQSKYHHLNMKVRDMLRTQGIDSEKISFLDNPNETKMSAVILKLAEPYIKMYWGDELRVRGIISLTVAVWNMTFLSQENQTDLQERWIDKILPEDCDAQDIGITLTVFENLERRKSELFPNNRTFIMGHDLTLDSENIHLNVSSAPLGKTG